ncbi:cache domain-containing protein [Sulfurimonas sp. HSL3-7]|uniref:cache domain-containing protein n=1 Tax=Sulfonitrofixus jiaomeiensis TaxID=3131938 RepID=UPI0031F9AEA8
MKLYQKYLALMLLLLLIAIVYFYIQNKHEFVNRVDVVLINLLDKQIEEEKAKAFAFAFALSQNETLQTAIQNSDGAKGYEILKRYMSTLETFSGSKVRTQIISKDFVIFARSWDNRDAGLPIKEYRPDLEEMVRTLEPHLSFEAARRLVLIASIPIVKEGAFIGFVEVIQKFDAIEDYFANYDVDLLVLLDAKYEAQAVLLDKNPRIGDTIVANEGANIHHIAYMQKTGVGDLLTQGILEGENHFYFSKAILNSEGQNIGSFILILSKKKLSLFSAFEEELDTFFTYARKDLYYSIINRDPSINSYHDFTDKELLLLKKCVHGEDRVALEEKLRKQLENYTQDELISLLLDVNSNKKSRGEIK